MKNILLLLLGSAFLASSCSDFLDVKPVGKLIPTEVPEFETLMNESNVSNGLLSYSNGVSDLMLLSDNVELCDEAVKNFYNPTSVLLSHLAVYSFSTPYINLNLGDGVYEKAYKATSIFNNVIEGIEGIGKADDPHGKEVISQAKAARAWMYLTLGTTYGPMYNPVGANTSKCIAYRTSGDIAKPSPNLSTTEELFAQVEADLLSAEKGCPNQVVSPIRASKAAVKALLSYLYMYKGDFENMYKYSREAWDLQIKQFGVDGLIYDYNSFSYKEKIPAPAIQPGEDVRALLELQTPDNMHNQAYNIENLFYRAHSTSNYYFKVSKSYLNLFDQASDLRYQLFLLNKKGYTVVVNDVTYSEGIVKYDYRSKIKGSIGITNPELLLMLAESAARTNREGEAIAALNTLRKYRYVKGTPELALSGEGLLQEILKERRREIPVTSPIHYWDLKRYAFESGKPWSKQKLSRTILGKEYSVDIKSENFQMKIANPYINFNPQWGLTPNLTPWTPYSQFQ